MYEVGRRIRPAIRVHLGIVIDFVQGVDQVPAETAEPTFRNYFVDFRPIFTGAGLIPEI